MKTISIVDDNQMMREFLRDFLSSDYRVDTYSDGDQLLWQLQNTQEIPDLVIADYQMDGCNGFDLLKTIKTSGFYSQVPVLLLSGIQKSETRIACLEAGAEDYVSKPFNPGELSLKIKKALRS